MEKQKTNRKFKLGKIGLGPLFKYEQVVSKMPFIFFVAVLSALYISNNHKAVLYVGEISSLENEVEELSWQYETVNSELTHRSTLTEIAAMVDTLGLAELDEPQYKIKINKSGR